MLVDLGVGLLASYIFTVCREGLILGSFSSWKTSFLWSRKYFRLMLRTLSCQPSWGPNCTHAFPGTSRAHHSTSLSHIQSAKLAVVPTPSVAADPCLLYWRRPRRQLAPHIMMWSEDHLSSLSSHWKDTPSDWKSGPTVQVIYQMALLSPPLNFNLCSLGSVWWMLTFQKDPPHESHHHPATDKLSWGRQLRV